MARRPASTIPRYKRRRKGSTVGRAIGWIVKLVIFLVLASVAWVILYRFVNPPITLTMIGDRLGGRSVTREWMPIGEIDRDMVRAAIAAEDSKFCSHHGFDFKAIEKAREHNVEGARIRGGSTISQQTAKNAFLWQGGGYPRKAAEAWFTFLIEQLWGKRRIMEVYLNLAETGIGTYGVSAGSERYFGHDASAMSPSEAARLAAILPLPKKRGAVAPVGFTRRYGGMIAARLGIVARDGLDRCVYAGAAAPREQAPPPVTNRPRPQPGADYEAKKIAPRAVDPETAEPEVLPPDTADQPVDLPPVENQD